MAKHTITGANLDDIRDRLEDMSTYHPGDARTFADWSLEAGDIITMKREDSEYSMPVYNTKMVWKGTPEITVSSTGKKQLDPVSRVSKQRYGRGGNAVRSQERIYYDFTSEDGLLHSAIAMSEANLTVAFQDADAGLQTQITANARGLEVEAQARSDADIEMQGQLVVHADEVALVVSATDDRPVRPYAYESLFPRPGDTRYIYLDLNTGKYYEWNVENSRYVEVTRGNRINRGGIISAINDDGTVTTSILGNKVIISELDDEDLDSWAADAKNGEGVFTRYLTVRRLNAQEINTMLLNADGEMHVGGTVYADGVQLNSNRGFFSNEGYIKAESIDLDYAITILGGIPLLVSDAYIRSGSDTLTIVKADSPSEQTVTISKSQDGATLTFTDSAGGSFTFEKATSKVRGIWSGDTLEISAYQYGQELPYTSQISTQFYANPTTPGNYQYFVGSFQQDNGAQQATPIQGTQKQIHLGKIENQPNTIYIIDNSTGSFVNNAPIYNLQLETRTVEGNGTYSRSSGMDGISSFTVNVPSDLPNASVRFSANSGQYYVEAYDTVSGLPTSSNAHINYKLGVLPSSPTTVRVLNQAGTATVEGYSPTYPIPIQSLQTITANGTYIPSEGFVGFGSFEVDVQGGSTVNARSRFNASSGQYYIESYDYDTGDPIVGSSVTYKLGRSGATVQIQDMNGTRISSTPEITVPLESRTVNANNTYTPATGYAGFSSITVAVPSDIENAKSRFNAASGSYYIESYDNRTSNPIANSSVTYKLGLNAAGTKVQIQTTGGTQISSTPEYTIPSPNVNTWALTNYTSPYSYNATVQVNGVTYTSGTLNAIDAYAKGWTNCYAGVGLDSTAATTLNYGQSITVYAQAYSTKDATSKTNKASRTITAPADRYNNGWTGAYQKVGLPGAGTAATMTVNTPNSTSSASPNPVSTVYTVSADNSYAYIKQGSTTVARVSNPAYANGWTAAYQKVGLPAAGTAATMTVSTPNSSSSASPNPVTTTYTVSADNTYAYIKIGSTVYARAPHNAYGNGQAAVTLAGPTWSGTTGTSAGISNTATVSTSGRPTALSKTVPVTLSPGSWSNNKKYVDITTTNGTIVARTEVDASSIYSAGYTAGCTNIKVSGWTSTYSGNSAKRYTIISGSGTNAVLGMSFNVTATNGYVQELVFDAPAGAGKAVTMAYRDGYSAGKSAGSNPYPYTKTLKCTGATFTQSQWKYTFEYWNSTSGTFKSGSSYKFHHNSGYT